MPSCCIICCPSEEAVLLLPPALLPDPTDPGENMAGERAESTESVREKAGECGT